MSTYPATASPDRSGTACAVCGAAAERGQLICLECGSRITLAYRRPPSWKVPVAVTVVILALAVAGGAVAFQAIDDDARREAGAVPAQPKERPAGDESGQGGATDASADGEAEPEDTAPDAGERDEDARGGADGGAADGGAEGDGGAAADGGASADGGVGGEPAGDDRPAADTGGLVKRGDLYTWPQSLRAFTVVLLSSEDRPSATSFARSAGGSPRTKIGVIRSNDFETLPRGFFVVFAGEYESRQEADRAAARLGGRFPGAFAQLVRR